MQIKSTEGAWTVRALVALVVPVLVFTLAACGSEDPASSATAATQEPAAPTESPAQEEQKPDEPVDLTGEWRQTNPNDPTSLQTAVIGEGRIEIVWEMEDMRALYWAGTYEPGGSWTSQADTEALSGALFGSTAETKDFEYADGVISYEVTAMGVTIVVTLERV